MRLHYLALLSVFLSLPLDAVAQCGPGGCSAVGRVRAAQEWEWRYDTENGYLYRYGQLVGTWNYTHRKWLPVIKGTLAPFPVPVGCPDGCCCDICNGSCGCSSGDVCSDSCSCVAKKGRVIEQVTQNFGIDRDKMHPPEDGPIYRYNGMVIPRARAYEAISSRIPDDAGKLWLTVIGEQRQKVLDDIAKSKALETLRDKLIVKGYPSDHWAVAQMGYIVSGKPTIYLQAADGKVIHRQDDYQDGPEGLAEAIRKANDRYDPKSDPDLRKKVQLPSIPVVPLVAIASGLALLFLLRKRA